LKFFFKIYLTALKVFVAMILKY